MNNKFIFFIALLSLALLSVNVALAAPSLSMTWLTSPSDLYEGQNKTVSCNITNNGDSNLTVSLTAALSSLGLNSSESSISIPINDSVSRSYTITTNSTSNIGVHIITITAFGVNASSSNTTSTLSSSFNVLYPYCENITGTNDPIDFIEITNDEDIDGEEFKPLDSFDIKVKVENNDDNDDDDNDHKVIITAVLVKDNEEVDDTEVEQKVTIDAEDKETVTLTMALPSDIEEGTYYLYVKAENDDDSDNCEQKALSLEIEQSTREVIYIGPSAIQNISCGSTLLVEGNIFNIGKEDEDKVKISYSDKFGNTQTEEYNSLDSGDSLPLNWQFNIPQNTSAGKSAYTITISYDYDEDDETYDETESFLTDFNVYGVCQAALVSNQTISTESSTAILGVESEVRVKITNTGTTAQTFLTTATADWAEINSITPSSVSLNAGEEKEIIIKLEPKSNVEIGANDLVVSVQHNGITDTKTVSVNVQKSSAKAGLIEQLQFQLKYNPTWVIIDTALVVAIIVVVILLFTGKKH